MVSDQWSVATDHWPLLLFLAPADLHVEADNTVLVAVADEGNAAIDIVLPLNDLLRTLRNIGGVREGEVVGELLLDGDLRAVADGIGDGAESLRIDFNIAGAEQALEAAAGGVIDGLVEDEIAGLIGKHALAGLLLELRRLFVGAAQGEQSDDVGFRQGRLGPVVNVEAVGCANYGDVEIVVADMAGGLQVELGFDGNRVGESDVAALERKTDAVECGFTFKDIDTAENGGTRRRSAEAKIGVAGKAGNSGAVWT